MNNKLKNIHAHQIASLYLTNNLTESLKESRWILDSIVYLNETLVESNAKFPDWKVYSDTIVSKYIFHYNTLLSIISGTQLKLDSYKRDIKVMDIPSSYIVLRAMLESFLTYMYIYVNPSTEEEKKFRFEVWMYCALVSRQNFSVSSDEGKKRIADEKLEIEKLKNNFSNTSFFKSNAPRVQKNILDGISSKVKTWPKVIKECNIGHNMKLEILYSLLSSYAHSEGLSILQIKSSQYNYDTNNPEANLILLYSKALTCLFIKTLLKEHSIIQIKFNMLPQFKRDKIDLYSRILSDK